MAGWGRWITTGSRAVGAWAHQCGASGRQGTWALPYRIFYRYTLRRAGPACSAVNYRRSIRFMSRKPRRVCRPQAANQMQSFLAGACTWPKILLGLQVWNLFAFSEQILRAADCKPFVQKGLCPFWTIKKPAAGCGPRQVFDGIICGGGRPAWRPCSGSAPTACCRTRT